MINEDLKTKLELLSEQFYVIDETNEKFEELNNSIFTILKEENLLVTEIDINVPIASGILECKLFCSELGKVTLTSLYEAEIDRHHIPPTPPSSRFSNSQFLKF